MEYSNNTAFLADLKISWKHKKIVAVLKCNEAMFTELSIINQYVFRSPTHQRLFNISESAPGFQFWTECNHILQGRDTIDVHDYNILLQEKPYPLYI